jgi:hypothetical protein
VARWIELERAGRADEAEASLFAALCSWRRVEPSHGFADRVLRAAGMASPEPGLLAAWWVRGGLVIGFGLAGLAVLALPVGSLVLAVPSYAGFLLSRAVGVSVAAGNLARHALACWSFLVQVGEALQLTVTTPPVLAVLFVSVLMAGGALYLLSRLLVLGEEMVEC